MALADIETIVIVIMENRSFDHMLGYLSLQGILPIDGLQRELDWTARYANEFAGKTYPVFRIDSAATPCSDPQHNYQSIALQISKRPAGGAPLEMGGFVESYARLSDPLPADPSAVMGYLDSATLPTFNFFARNYCVCDRWFAALPLGTQANRLMAMAGESLVLDNIPVLLPDQPLVYDWLTAKEIPWRAYQAGDFFPFFSLMGSWLPEIVASLTVDQLVGGDGRFRRFARFADDWTAAGEMPSVIFVEPEYTDGPHVAPNDDHSPTGVVAGQAFLAQLYGILVSNPARWARTLLVVTYDEHGGFFDHVRPLPIATTINGTVLSTSGVRVPAFLISPYVEPGYVFNGPLDHTSILQLLDDRFVKGEGYSVAVNNRQKNLNRILNALTPEPRTGTVPEIDFEAALAKPAPLAEPTAPSTANARAFDQAAKKFGKDHPRLVSQPGWENMRAYLAKSAQSAAAVPPVAGL